METLNPGLEAGINIGVGSLTEAFDEFLDKFYFWQGKTIKLDNVQMGVDESGRSLSFSGTASYLNIPNMPVSALFTTDDAGQVQATLKYSLISEEQTASYWCFSKSFPDLPAEFDYSDGSHFNDMPALDRLLFYKAHVIVTTHAQQEGEYQIELQEGINFIGDMKPLGALGILENILQPVPELTIFGQLHIPKDYSQVFLPRALQDLTAARVYPWEVAEELPGIHLQARLNTEFTAGNVKFRDAVFRIYSPLTSDWLTKGDIYRPVNALTAGLNIPSADISVDAIAFIEKGLNTISVETRFEGVSLGNLARLADLTGSESLTAQLPDTIVDAVEKLERLELMDLAFSIVWGKQGIYPSYASIQIGMPDLNWRVWGDHLAVNSIGCRFSISDPLTEPEFDINLWGKTEIEGVPVTIKTASRNGFVLMAMLEEKQTIPLKQLIESHLPQVPPPANLTVNNLFVAIAPKQFYMMSCALAEKPAGWKIKLGPTELSFSNLRMDLTKFHGGDTSGQIRGEIAFDRNITLNAVYTMPGDFVVQTEIKEISFQQLTKKFSDTPLALPSDFDLTLKNSSILIKKDNSGYLFQTATTIDKFGIVAFEARKVNGQKFGVAAGVSLTARPSQLPGLGALKPLEKVVALQDLLLIVASYDANDFRFPDMAAFSNPALTNHNMPMPKQANGIQAGLNLYAKWKINNSDKQQKLLQTLLGLNPEMAITLQVGKQPQNDSRLFVSHSTRIDGKWPLNCQFGFAMNKGTPEIFLAGQLLVNIQKKPCRFDIAMSMVKSGAFFAGTMQGTIKVESIQLSNLALVVGINWGGIPSLGVAASINSKAFSSSVAFFFDSTDPSRSILAGSVSDLSLQDIATTIAGSKSLPKELTSVLGKFKIQGRLLFKMPARVAALLDASDIAAVSQAFNQHGKTRIPSDVNRILLVINQPGNLWHITDMQNEMRNYQVRKDQKTGQLFVYVNSQLYCAPQHSQIGTLEFQQGFYLNGTLNILGLQSTTTVEVSTNKGIAFESYLNKPLVLGNENVFKLSDMKGKNGPRVSMSTFSQPNKAEQMFRKPHLYMDGQVRLLGLKSECLVQITQNGAIFHFAQNAQAKFSIPAFSGKSLFAFSVDGKIDAKQGADITTAVKLELQGKISPGKLVKMPKGTPLTAINKMGSITLREKLAGSVRIKVTGKQISASFTTRVKLEGLPAIKINTKLNVKTGQLIDLGEIVCKEIEKEVKKIVTDVTKWAKWAEQGIIQGVKGVEQVGEVMVDVFGKSPEAAVKALKDIGKGVEDVGKVLNKVYKVNPKDAEKFLRKSFKISDKDLKKVLKGAGYAAREVDKFFDDAGKEIGKGAKKVGKEISKGAKKVGKFFGL
ncbi:MAG: hypothetical protein OEZ39_09890 [Gammaproteobacteria bacterium]|nr:hypothetical protein [Gammaproteobacteria bacterium]